MDTAFSMHSKHRRIERASGVFSVMSGKSGGEICEIWVMCVNSIECLYSLRESRMNF